MNSFFAFLLFIATHCFSFVFWCFLLAIFIQMVVLQRWWLIYIYNDALFSYIFIYCLIFSLFIVLLVHCRICYIDTSLRTLPANKVFLDSSCLQATFTRVIICIHVEILVSQEYACFFLQTSFCVLLETFLCFARDT